MEVVTLLLFVGLIWLATAIALFTWNLRSAHHEHADRLAVLPLQDNWTDSALSAETVRVGKGKRS